MQVALGLDVGTKTIGVAVSDGLGMLAHPVCTVSRQGVRKDCEALARIVQERGAGVLIVGMPFELDGSEDRSARLARQVGEALADRTGLQVHYVDERYSSVDAERRLIAAGVSRGRRKEIIDQAAAVGILQGWLDEQASRRAAEAG